MVSVALANHTLGAYGNRHLVSRTEGTSGSLDICDSSSHGNSDREHVRFAKAGMAACMAHHPEMGFFAYLTSAWEQVSRRGGI